MAGQVSVLLLLPLLLLPCLVLLLLLLGVVMLWGEGLLRMHGDMCLHTEKKERGVLVLHAFLNLALSGSECMRAVHAMPVLRRGA